MAKDFEQLAAETLEKIKSFGTDNETQLHYFKQTCRMLNIYLAENALKFSLENGQKWLSEVQPSEPVTHSEFTRHSARRRIVIMLAEHQEGKLDIWRIYREKTAVRPKTKAYIQLLNAHTQKLQTEGFAKSTIDMAMTVGSDFLIYLEESGKLEINSITPRDVIGYFTQDSFSKRKPGGVKSYAYKLKSFLAFLEDTGIVTGKKLSLAVPKIFGKQESIVTVLSEKAVETIKNGSVKSETCITSPRDHAMILLALRLGIRRSDIKKMRMSDIDWNDDNISFAQQKTDVPVTLPLLSDVGNALMEYILYFRPQSESETVFVRHNAPHQTLVRCDNVARKYLSVFDSEDCPERGFHILRRTCATNMLKNNISRSVISASIGQIDPNSVDVYLSADEEKMRKCAISLKGIECGRADLR